MVDRWLNNVNVVRVVAVLIGILLWLVIRLNYDQITPGGNNPIFQSDTIVDAKVTVRNLDEEQYYLSSLTPEAVNILVEGPTSALNRIPSSEYAIVADLSGLAEGTHEVTLIAENFPYGVSVMLEPSTVSVTIERMETKQFDVVIETIGTPAEGLRAGVPVVNPARVHATVPEGRLNDIQSIRGQVNIQGATDTITREVKLEAYDSNGQLMNGVTISPSIVSVEVPITPPLRSVPLQVNLTGRLPGGLSVADVSTDIDYITIYGPQEVIDRIDFYEGLTVDLSTITEDTTLTLEVPLNHQITNVEPSEVVVTIDVEPTVQRTFREVPIRMFGETEDTEIELTSPENGTISITVGGAAQLVNRLSAGDVQVILDVSNITPGSYVLPLRVTLPKYISLIAADELRASVTVTEASEETSSQPPDRDELPADESDQGAESGGDNSNPESGSESEEGDGPATGGSGNEGAGDGNVRGSGEGAGGERDEAANSGSNAHAA